MVGPSLDRFIKKRVTNKIFLMPKGSRLAEEKSPVRFSNGRKQNGSHLKDRLKFCPKNNHLNSGRSGFWMLTVL
jgi:hypothetical protein